MNIKLDRRYNLTLWLAFGCIGALVLGLFVWQVNRLHDEAWKQTEARLQRHHQAIEAVLRSFCDEIEALRAVAQDAPPEQAPVWPQAHGGGYSLDHIGQPDRWGNLIGQGPLKGIGRRHHQDLLRALGLAPWLSAIPYKQPAVAEARYVSPHGFVLVHPWRAARHLSPYAPEPDDNTQHRRWGMAYFGGQDKGLLVPLSAPVALPSGGTAWVRLDLSLDHLNRLNQTLDEPLGVVGLVSERGQVLAHPHLHRRGLAMQSTPTLNDWRDAQPPQADETHWPMQQRTEVDGLWWYRLGFRAAPWQLWFVMDARAAWWRIWWQQSAALAEVLLGMLALMLLAHTLTRREFVQPALKLVQFLGHTSRSEQARIPEVPQAWRPWFERVRAMMQESRQLLAVEQELRIAAQMQQAILPTDWPCDAQHRLEGLMRAARHVGGDFYDHLRLPDGSLSLIVADVSGKGVGAALFGMVCKTHYRALALAHGHEPGRLLEGINRALCVSNPQCMFVTAWCGHYRPDSGQLHWAGAGHPAALWCPHTGSGVWLQAAQGVALGLLDDGAYPSHALDLGRGDQLLIYTDGVTEAINPAQAEFGTERLLEVATHTTDPRQRLPELMRAIDRFVAGEEPFDDITCLVLSRTATAA